MTRPFDSNHDQLAAPASAAEVTEQLLEDLRAQITPEVAAKLNRVLNIQVWADIHGTVRRPATRPQFDRVRDLARQLGPEDTLIREAYNHTTPESSLNGQAYNIGELEAEEGFLGVQVVDTFRWAGSLPLLRAQMCTIPITAGKIRVPPNILPAR